MYSGTPANSTMLSTLRAISERVIPNIDPFRKMFSRPVSSGENPEPTSISADRRPRILISPEVGALILAKSFKRVLFPAPLFPMMPRDSPPATSKLTSRRAHISFGFLPRKENSGQPRDRVWLPFRMRYRFETWSSLMSNIAVLSRSNHVGHSGFCRFEISVGQCKARQRDCAGGDEH